MRLRADFEAQAEAAMLQAVAQALRESDRAEQLVREGARDALVGAGYDAEGILEELVGPEVVVADDRVRVAFTVDHEAAEHLEFGTSEHTIEGGPVLAFEWAEAPDGVREAFADTFPTVFFVEVTVDGVEETGFTRAALRELRRDIQRP